MSKFSATANKGFQLEFANGLVISVQFGKGNYCNNQKVENSDFITESSNAEIAIWEKGTPKNEIFFKDGAYCIGWVNADDVAEWIYKTKTAKSFQDLQDSI